MREKGDDYQGQYFGVESSRNSDGLNADHVEIRKIGINRYTVSIRKEYDPCAKYFQFLKNREIVREVSMDKAIEIGAITAFETKLALISNGNSPNNGDVYRNRKVLWHPPGWKPNDH